LRFNFPPAKIFLGDAGSMLIGLIIGALAIRAALKGPATVALAAPLAIWAIPIFDSTAAVLRRKLTGRSLYTTDRGHLHHLLLARSGSARLTLAWIALACAATSIGAVVGVYFRSDFLAVSATLLVIGLMIATRVFGYVELLLLWTRLKSFVCSLTMPASRRDLAHSRDAGVRLQGTRPWGQLWTHLIESTEKFDLNSLRLDVNMPAVHEGYHASWQSPEPADESDLWRTEIPLYAGDQVLGRLTITGVRGAWSVLEVIDRLMELLQGFEVRLLTLTERVPSDDLELGPLNGDHDETSPLPPQPLVDTDLPLTMQATDAH